MPPAVSPLSIIPSVPSKMALAISLVSARVGRGLFIIDSSICVAVTTGFPACWHLRMTIFCKAGTSSAGTSTPKSPRATMTPSLIRIISSILSIAVRLSTFDMIFIELPCFSRTLRIDTTSLPLWINEAAIQSIFCEIPNSMSFISVSDKAGNLMGIPGTATRLRSLILPLFRTCVTMSSSTTDRTSKLTRPSDKSIWSPAFTSCGKPLYDTEAILSVPSTSRAVKINSCPAFISIAPFLNRPKRISGPFVSSNRATGFPTFRAAARTASIRLPCSS